MKKFLPRLLLALAGGLAVLWPLYLVAANLWLGQGGLEVLADRTHAYLEQRVVPNLTPTGINVVGFTCTFDQIYSR